MNERDKHHSQGLRAVPAVQLEPLSEDVQAEIDRQVDASLEVEREQARMRGTLQAFETKLLGDLMRRETREVSKLVDLQRQALAVEREVLGELRAMKSSMEDLAKPDVTQESILDEQRGIRDLLREVSEGINALVMMKSNGHAH